MQELPSSSTIESPPHIALDVSAKLMEDTAFFHDVISDWIEDPNTTIACGRWSDGAVSEIIPSGRARLLPARYHGCFAGVREIRLDDGPHHLHIDLGRVHKVCYAIAPSVCLAFKPSLEVRMLTIGPGGAPTDRWTLSLMPDCPYKGDHLDETVVHRFFERMRLHANRAPGLVEIDPPCLPLLGDALALREASLVIYRERTLVEFQTEKIDGVHRYEEKGHVSWQIGGLRDHHCHLALGAVHRVMFSAEPVSCQGQGLNYTIWFLTSGPSGNPWRRDGYFSVVLNRPYTGDAPRLEVIQPVLDLYLRYRDEPWVLADARFLSTLEQGVPDRRHQSLVLARSS